MTVKKKESVSPAEAMKKPLDAVIGFVLKAASTWRRENTEETIQAKTKKLLDKRAEEMTMKLLGFTDSWGEWKVDHCNGRAGESAVGDYLRRAQSQAIKEFFDSLELSTVITPTMRNKLVKAMKDGYEYQLSRAVHSAVTAHAQRVADKALEHMTSSDDLEKVIKTMHLLDMK